MKVIYHNPLLATIYANRTIYNGYKNAFEDLGHKFITFTQNDNLEAILNQHKPDIFITSSHFFYRKFLDFKLLRKYRDKGMVLFTKIDFWNSPITGRINEAKSMKDDKEAIYLIKNGLLGDIFFHSVEQGDKRMDGFEKETGYKYHTIPLAVDSIALKPRFNRRFQADISYVGTYLPQKREFFNKYVFPLKKKYNLRLYGQDWTQKDRMLGWLQRFGQYFNIPIIRSLQKPKLQLSDEGDIYASSTISINVHEQYQKVYGGECNERTFKIPFCGGFEITDDVSCIRKYFKEGSEIVIVKNMDDWYEKIAYYLKYPEKRISIIEAGNKIVKNNNTYHNRVNLILSLYRAHK